MAKILGTHKMTNCSAFPKIRGVVARRILVNFTADPETVQQLLPPIFRPKLLKGKAVVGICLIRLEQIRPIFVPQCLGISSENVAHRIAVEWEEEGVSKEGVYILRRDTNSLLIQLGGGRIFPGVQNTAQFSIQETGDEFHLKINSADKAINIEVEGTVSQALPPDSIFESLEVASEFFAKGSVGYSPGSTSGRLEGMELRTLQWQVEPLEVSKVSSSFFEDEHRFPRGSIQYDSALLMRNLEHEWHAQGSLCLDECKSE